MASCFVYFIQAGDELGAIKIGYSVDVEKRIDSLRTGNHLPLRLLAKFDLGAAAPTFERELHDAFFDLRLEGEWFTYDQRIVELIEVLGILEQRAAAPQQPHSFTPSLRDRLHDVPAVTQVVALSASHDRTISDWHVVEWSYAQGCIHVDHLSDSVAMAWQQHVLGHGTPTDYVIIAIAPSREDAHRIANVLEPALRAMRVARRCGALDAFKAAAKGPQR